MTIICVSCSKTVPARSPYMGLKGQFKKLCRACHFTADEISDEQKTSERGFMDSFVSFTCNYGYIICLAFCVWILQASLHRHENKAVHAKSAHTFGINKADTVKTSWVMPFLGP